AGKYAWRLIVEAALRDLKRLVFSLARDAIDQPVFLRDPARPPALQVAPQRLGLAGALERGAAAFLDQRIEPVEYLAVGVQPVPVIVPGVVGEDELHGRTRSRSVPRPSSIWR